MRELRKLLYRFGINPAIKPIYTASISLMLGLLIHACLAVWAAIRHIS